MATVLAKAFVLTAVVLSARGSYLAQSPLVVAAGASFGGVFLLALRGAAGRHPMFFQVGLVLLLVALSLVLHLLCLPAGICCFVALMTVKNSALVPAPAAAQRRPRLDPKAQ